MGFELPSIDVKSLSEADGRGVRVLVLDSGIETSHPDLAGLAIKSYRVEAEGDDELRRIVEFIRGGGMELARAEEIADLERRRRALQTAQVGGLSSEPEMLSRPTHYENLGGGIASAAANLITSFFFD